MLRKLKRIFTFKVLTILVSIFFIIIIVLWLALPNILKNYIESHDKEWINRDITIQKIDINPFTFKVSIYNTIIKEPNSETNFLSFDKLLINFDFWSLLKSKINTQEITLTNLLGNVIQNGKQFNFSDMLNTSNSDTNSEPIEFNLRNINILKSSIHYTDAHLNSKIILDSISIKDQSFTSNDTIFDANINIHQPEDGRIKGNVIYNFKNHNYKINTNIETWKLAPFKKYATSVIKLSEFDGQLDADLKIAGNVSTNFIESHGQIKVSNFKLVDPESKPLMSMGEFFIDIKQINNKENVYDFKNIWVKNSNIAFEYLPHGDNFTKWLVAPNIPVSEKEHDLDYYVSPFEMLSIYIYDMTKEYIFKSYTAEKILFSNFNLKFYDYTLEDTFYLDLENLEIEAHDIKPENQYANFNLAGKINTTGVLNGAVSVSRQGVENMTVDMNIKGLFLNRFSPYGRHYTAHRFVEGISAFNNQSVIKDSYLTSTNKIHIEKIKVSKKDKTKNGSSLPMRLAVALMRDSNGNIDIEIPIEGPINDPKYKFGKVVWQVIKNLFTKVATSPIKALSNTFKVNEDDLKNVYFDNGQIRLSPSQKKSLDALVKVLNKKPEIIIELTHLYNKEYEMNAIALKSAKVAYLKQSGLSLDEKIPLGKHAFDLSSTDPQFLEYLKREMSNFDNTISIPENTLRMLGKDFTESELTSVTAKQKQIIKAYLINEKGIVEDRFIIKDGATSEEAINQSRPKFEVKFQVKE